MSLRVRFAAGAAAVAFVLTTVAGLLVATAQWSAERSAIVERAELLSIDQADAAERGRIDTELLPVAEDEFTVALVDDQVVAAEGSPPQEIQSIAVDNALASRAEEGTVAVDQFELDGVRWATAVTSCLDPEACDLMVAAVRAPSWIEAIADRLVVTLLVIVSVTALAALAAAWLAARALRPVEAMRAELASTTASDLTHRVPVAPTGDELEQLGTTLNETLDRLERAVSANQRFTADAAHELRSPLAGIRAAVELRAHETGDDLLEEALEAIDRANALVDDLLVLARGLEATDRSEPVDLTDVISHHVERVRREHPDRRVNFDARALEPFTIPQASANRIVGNLLDNACRHASSAVRADLTTSDGWAHVWVVDDGPGIPHDQRERVFERFVRLDESRARASGGAGLGLAIVSETTAALGGTVAVDDAPGGGAAVRVSLPRSVHGQPS